MPEDQNEYPPQFASSDLSSLLGQINDFVGLPPPPPPPPGPGEMAMAKSASKPAQTSGQAGTSGDDLGRRLASGTYALPVSIVGGRPPGGPYLPGLKDVLIAVTYLRLADQIASASHKNAAQKFAYELMQKGNGELAEHIAKQRGPGGKKK